MREIPACGAGERLYQYAVRINFNKFAGTNAERYVVHGIRDVRQDFGAPVRLIFAFIVFRDVVRVEAEHVAAARRCNKESAIGAGAPVVETEGYGSRPFAFVGPLGNVAVLFHLKVEREAVGNIFGYVVEFGKRKHIVAA